MVVFLSDNFDTYTPGTNLAVANPAWDKLSNTSIVITATNATAPSAAACTHKHTATPGSANYTIAADIKRISETQGYVGVTGRIVGSTDATMTGYGVRYNWNLDRLEFIRFDSGGTVVIVSTVGQVYGSPLTVPIELRLVGGTQAVWANGASVLTASDTTYSAAGNAGLWESSTSGNGGTYLDNFVATDDTVGAQDPVTRAPARFGYARFLASRFANIFVPSGAALSFAVSDSDTLTGGDAALRSAALAVADAGTLTGADAASRVSAVTVADASTLTGNDAVSLDRTPSTIADSGTISGADAASRAAAVAVADTGTLSGADAATRDATVSLADSGALAGADAVSVARGAVIGDTDTLAGADTTITARGVAVADADVLAGSDAALRATAATIADSAVLAATDAVSVTIIPAGGITITVDDTGSIAGADTAVLTTNRVVADSGTLTGTDAVQIVFTRSVADSDVLTATESLQRAAALTLGDAGSLVDSDAILVARGVTVADLAALIGADAVSVQGAGDISPESFWATLVVMPALGATLAVAPTLTASMDVMVLGADVVTVSTLLVRPTREPGLNAKVEVV